MKKLCVIFVMALAVVMFAGCAGDETAQSSADTSVLNLVDGNFSIASLQIAAHPALDAARNGFLSGLADEGFVEGHNLEFDIFNALGDMSNAHIMAVQIVDNEPDLILGIATSTSQALAQATTTIPITITAVTSPYRADLVDSHERPNRNVTGTTDMTPVAIQFDLITRLFPEVQTVGILYNSGEINSAIQADLAEEAANALGLTLDRMSVAVAGDIMQAAQMLANRVEVIYTPTCNLIAAGMVAVVRASEELGVPVVAGDSGSVANGALITYGVDYYELGRQTAVMAAQILRGEAQPQTMPIQSQAQYRFAVNTETARILGIEIPADILAAATIYEN
ncbi:MAG: ABC transporter substrate-binding protein [Defluviitaleaceae bacterium]|nr:ABC transporter substrate-binding protein [Defluviitaleaceae bacterium]